jgi:predicted class III extradiol MEMO1 family dioxygenase
VTESSTRARRYANHISGTKYQNGERAKGKKVILPRTDPQTAQSKIKAEAAEIFRTCLEQVKADKEYVRLAERHRRIYESQPIPEDTSQFEEDMDTT